MKTQLLSTKYDVRKITNQDILDVFNLCKSNPLYYKYCPPTLSMEEIKSDLIALPPNKTIEDKYYIGFYESNQLIAVMDLICKYPNDDTAFIGFFMVNSKLQKAGIGSNIIAECLQYLKSVGYTKVRLGYVKNNPQSKAFWEKNHFKPTGVEVRQELYTAVVMEKII